MNSSRCSSDLKKYFEESLVFLKDYKWIYNNPNTDILSRNVLDEIPEEWKSYFQKLNFGDLKDISLCIMKDGCPQSLADFFEKFKSLSIPRKSIWPKSRKYKLSNNHGLSLKKQHEISSLAPVIADICAEVETNQVIDIGAGLGYLSHLLAEEYSFSVLAIEGCPQKTDSALKTQLKHHESTRDKVKFHNHFITEDSAEEIRQRIENTFSKAENICMTGLHACADLSVTILDLFLKIDEVRSLVIMPCCYHRLSLKKVDEGREFFEGFPVSETLKYEFEKQDASDFLRRPFLRLACQTTLTSFLSMSDDQLEEHARNLLMRAVLQKAAEEAGCNVARLKRKSGKSLNTSDFTFYLENFYKYYQLLPKASGGEYKNDRDVEKRIIEIWESNKDKLILMEALTALQTSIQSVCENVLLQDRVMFLLENGVDCYVQKIADDDISPRCHALIAIKR